MIPGNIRNKIIQDLSIVEVVSEYLPLTRKGNSYFGVCPFHDDKNPSMSVSDSVKMFNCFSCNTKGNVITFVAKYENISFDQATIKLAERIGLKISANTSKEALKQERLENIMNEAAKFYSFYLKNSEEGTEALKYLYDRGISDEIIEKFRIGLAPSLSDGLYQFLVKKGFSELDLIELGLVKQGENNKIHDIFRIRVMFPLASSNGKIVGFSGRIYTVSNQAKYINSNENVLFHKGEVLYNMHNAALFARQLDKIYLFEGFMDVIAAYRAGIKNGVATMGTALTKEHINSILSVTKNIVLCFDGDEAGIKAMRRSAKMLSSYNIIPEAVVLPNNFDPDEYIKEYGAKQLEAYLISKAKPVYYWLYKLAYDRVIKNDIASVEQFKHTVFEFIGEVNQETIIDYYLNQMANDLGIDVNSLKKDFVSKRTNYDSTTIAERPSDQQTTVKPVVLSEVPITKAIRRAYQIIIKHIIYSHTKLNKYLAHTQEFYPGTGLMLEFSIIQAIETEVLINPKLLNTSKFAVHNINVLCSDANYKEYVETIINDKLIDIKNDDDFEQSLNLIIKYIKKVKTRDIKNRIIRGDENAIKEFTNSKKDENNL